MLEYLLYVVLAVFSLKTIWTVPTLRFYLKFVIFCGVITLGAIYYAVEFLFRGRDYKNAWRFKKTFRLAGQTIGLLPVVKDSQNLVLDRPCIFVANHQSCIDVASLVDVWPERCTIVSKASLKYAGPVGLITWFARVIYIDRSKHKDAVSVMENAAKEARQNEVSVYLFPEGTRSCTGTLLPFKKGAFHMAIACQFPIQPIVIEPYTKFLDFETKRFDSASYYVQVLPPIETAGMDSSHVNSLLTETREKMMACLESLKTAPSANEQ